MSTILETSGSFITDTYLISAYDVAHGHLPLAEDLPFRPDLLFLDSGGYEVSSDTDLSAVSIENPQKRAWSSKQLTSVLDQWPDEVATVFVSYDHPKERKPFREQVRAARDLFKGRDHLKTFLLKPRTENEETLNGVLKDAIAHTDELVSFDIIGITEKEIGRSPLERMVSIAKLRRALDGASIKAPIHVFGALDPLSVCLYFIAGAEIFDGLTWIRYTYQEGRCVYTHNAGAMDFGLHVRSNMVKARSMTENIYKLQQLQSSLRDFQTTGNFDKLAPHSELISNACDTLETAMKGAI